MTRNRSHRDQRHWWQRTPQRARLRLEALDDRTLPSTVYVNAAWAGTPIGTDPDGAGPAAAFGTDSFALIQQGVNTAGAGGTVNVESGIYSENLSLNQPNQTIQAFNAAGGIFINPASGDAVTVNAGGVSINGNNQLTVTGNPSLGRNGVVINAGPTTLQNVTVTGFAGSGSSGVSISGAGASARLLSDTISGNATGVRVVGGMALLQGNSLLNNNTQGASSVGLFVQGGGQVDAGGGSGLGLGIASVGGNTFSGYTAGGALAIANLNVFEAAPGAGNVTSNVAAQSNTFTGATSYADIERLVYHRLDSQFSAFVDYRGALGVAAPSAVPNSFRYLAANTDRTDPLTASQRSVIQGISFQVNAPIALGSGMTPADLLTILREGPAGTPGYAAGSLPANNTALASTAFDLAHSAVIVDGSTGLTTVTVRFQNGGAYAGGSANMTEFGSLIDGIYRVNINGANASLLFGGSGTTVASGTATRFHRLFGDVDNSGELDAADFSALRNYLASSLSPFRPYFDFNANGSSQDDTAAFNARLGSSLIE